MSNLSYSERNNLYKQYGDVKVVFIDKTSMFGCHIFNKIDQHLQEIFGCKKVIGGCYVVTIGDFYQMKPVKDTYIFKNPDSGNSALATSTWTDHFKNLHIGRNYEINRFMHNIDTTSARVIVGDFSMK